MLLAIPHSPLAGESPPELPAEFREWLVAVETLITDEELDYFFSLEEDFRRGAFIDRFWKVRDPYPDTVRNEFRETWMLRVDDALDEFGTLTDARARFFMLNGWPNGVLLITGRVLDRCWERDNEQEIWFYRRTDRVEAEFAVYFFRPKFPPDSEYRAWLVDGSHDPARRTRLPVTDPSLFCDADAHSWAMERITYDTAYYRTLVAEHMTPPGPSSREWVATFAAETTVLPEGASTFDIETSFDFPGRNQNRTAVRGMVAVPTAALESREVAGQQIFQLLLTGEIVRDDRLFETLRYRFEMPMAAGVESVPLVFQRYLRPGTIRLLLKIEDLLGRQYAQQDLRLDVPSPTDLASIEWSPDSELFRRLQEAGEAAARGQTTIRIVPPQDDRIQVGPLRVNTVSAGEFARVQFLLDNRPLLTKRRPPFSVELNLGDTAAAHRLRVVAYDAAGEEVASDEIAINQGGQRFRVRLVEPRAERTYEQSLSAVVQVEVPDGQELERVEVFLDEQRMATLYQEPFVQPLLLQRPGLAYVRAVGYLADGNTHEDVVFINTPEYFEQLEVHFVELYATVTDADGRTLPELTGDDFKVWEDGEEQEIRRFEYVRDLPLHTALLIDTSSSMEEDDALSRVADAALQFAKQTIEPRDRVALVSFDSRPRVESRFTNDVDQIEGALAGLEAHGSTAIYDALVFALHYFDGVKGPKALLLLSDGKDEASRFDLEGALAVAQRIGVTVYVVGLRDLARDRDAKKLLRRIARETGGQSFFIESIDELPEVYQAIQEDLRSQYLVAYQSTSAKDPDQLRLIRVEVDRRGAEVRTLSGYYP
ncbi:MAG: VWA domain-containing protein [Thermoanaerobaculia bacterium]